MFPRPENIHISGISIQSTCQVERRKDPKYLKKEYVY